MKPCEKRDKRQKVMATILPWSGLPPDVLQAVDKLAEFKVRKGPEGSAFENMVREKERGNPRFAFLHDMSSPAHAYYQFRLVSLGAAPATPSMGHLAPPPPPTPPHGWGPPPLPPPPPQGWGPPQMPPQPPPQAPAFYYPTSLHRVPLPEVPPPPPMAPPMVTAPVLLKNGAAAPPTTLATLSAFTCPVGLLATILRERHGERAHFSGRSGRGDGRRPPPFVPLQPNELPCALPPRDAPQALPTPPRARAARAPPLAICTAAPAHARLRRTAPACSSSARLGLHRGFTLHHPCVRSLRLGRPLLSAGALSRTTRHRCLWQSTVTILANGRLRTEAAGARAGASTSTRASRAGERASTTVRAARVASAIKTIETERASEAQAAAVEVAAVEVAAVRAMSPPQISDVLAHHGDRARRRAVTVGGWRRAGMRGPRRPHSRRWACARTEGDWERAWPPHLPLSPLISHAAHRLSLLDRAIDDHGQRHVGLGAARASGEDDAFAAFRNRSANTYKEKLFISKTQLYSGS